MSKIHKTNQGGNYALVSTKNFHHRQVDLIQKQVLSYILATKRLIIGKSKVNTKFVSHMKKLGN